MIRDLVHTAIMLTRKLRHLLGLLQSFADRVGLSLSGHLQILARLFNDHTILRQVTRGKVGVTFATLYRIIQ